MIVWSKSAYADLEKLVAYFSEQGSAELGRRVACRISLAAERLALFPLAGRKGRIEGTREFLVPKIPYLMVYVSGKRRKKIEIVRIFSTGNLWPAYLTAGE